MQLLAGAPLPHQLTPSWRDQTRQAHSNRRHEGEGLIRGFSKYFLRTLNARGARARAVMGTDGHKDRGFPVDSASRSGNGVDCSGMHRPSTMMLHYHQTVSHRTLKRLVPAVPGLFS